MSAMADIPLDLHAYEPKHRRFSALRDLLLALSLTILAALAMEATAPPPDTAPSVQDWKGNSGTLPPLP